MKENNTMNVTDVADTANAKTGSMDIKVTVTLMQNQEGSLKANASILLNNVFEVTGIRIGISQKGNVFVSMPDYKTGRLDDNGKDIYQDIAYPVTRQFRQELYDEVVKEFHAVMGQETPQPEGE
ncbi:septation protein SpoVG family protein [Lachnospiraceae bacterium 54-11]